MYRLSIVFFVVFAVTAALFACGGDDSSDSSSAVKENARIIGTVEELLMTKVPEKNQSIFADIKNMLSVVVSANAQDGELCGISVKAFQNGVEVAAGETNCDGIFELNEVPEGPTELVFENELFSDSGFIDVPAGGTLNIKVSLDGDEETEVSINEINVTTGPVECEDGFLNIGNDDVNELNIIGNGDSCVDIIGSCDVSISAQNINLKECNVCINADNGAFVTVNAVDKFDCNADETGINSSGESDVIISGEKCTIESGEFQIVEDDGSDVNTDDCGEVDLEGPEGEGGDDEGEGEGDGEGQEGDDDDDNEENGNQVCEFDCSNGNCEIFCTEGVPGDCKEICASSDNISGCIQECAGIECGEAICEEVCVNEGEPVCEIVEEEVCEEVCEGECEEECVEFRKEELLNNDCFEGCLGSECAGLEGEALEICLGEHEGLCAEECTELVETDDCIEFEVVGCECDEVCEIVEEEVCEGTCEEFGLSCRFECEEINL